MLAASDGKLNLKATDLDIEVTSAIECDVTDPGEFTVSAKLLLEICKKMKGQIDFTHDNHRLIIKCGRSRFELSTMDSRDFPVMASQDYESTFTIQGSDVARLFNKTKYAMSSEDTRYYLNGVYLHHVDGKMVTVATDGHQLALAETDNEHEFPGVIVPRKTVLEMCKLLDIGEVAMSISETKIKFVGADYTIVSKVVDGAFPDYTRVIPQNNDKYVTADAKEVTSAVDRACLVSSDTTRKVGMKFSSGKCIITGIGYEGSSTDEIAVEFHGDEFEVHVNSKYLHAALAQSEGGKVDMSFGESVGAALIKPQEDTEFMSVVMMMRG